MLFTCAHQCRRLLDTSLVPGVRLHKTAPCKKSASLCLDVRRKCRKWRLYSSLLPLCDVSRITEWKVSVRLNVRQHSSAKPDHGSPGRRYCPPGRRRAARRRRQRPSDRAADARAAAPPAALYDSRTSCVRQGWTSTRGLLPFAEYSRRISTGWWHRRDHCIMWRRTVS